MSKFEDLTNKIVRKNPSRAEAKRKRLRKGRKSDDKRERSERSSESESKFQEQVRLRK